MKIIKIILYYLLLASTLYAGVGIISPLYETGWHFSLASLYWVVFSVLFIGSDLWLHHKISRLIALSILALAYLMTFASPLRSSSCDIILSFKKLSS